MKKSVVTILGLLVAISSSMAFAQEENIKKCPFAAAAQLNDDTTREYSSIAIPGATGNGLHSGKTKKRK